MPTYRGILRIIGITEDETRTTPNCESLVEAGIAIGELKASYVDGTVFETGVEKIVDCKVVEYTILTKYNEQTEQLSREWVKRDYKNYVKMLKEVRDAERKLHDVHRKHCMYLFEGKPLE